MIELQSEVVNEEQILAKKLTLAWNEYLTELDETIELLRAYLDARDRLAAKRADAQDLIRSARAANLPVPVTDSYEQRVAKDYEYRRFRDRTQTTTSKPW